jgi:hypothetical protein
MHACITFVTWSCLSDLKQRLYKLSSEKDRWNSTVSCCFLISNPCQLSVFPLFRSYLYLFFVLPSNRELLEATVLHSTLCQTFSLPILLSERRIDSTFNWTTHLRRRTGVLIRQWETSVDSHFISFLAFSCFFPFLYFLVFHNWWIYYISGVTGNTQFQIPCRLLQQWKGFDEGPVLSGQHLSWHGVKVEQFSAQADNTGA